MKIFSRIFLSGAAVALLCPLTAQPAAAQSSRPSSRPNVASVEVVIRDIDSRRDIATVSSGETVNLPEGIRVRMIMTALPAGSSRRPMYPATTFTDVNRGGVRITRSNEENSTADLEVVASRRDGDRRDDDRRDDDRRDDDRRDSNGRDYDRRDRRDDRRETIRYEITDTWVPASLRTGSFFVNVTPPGTAPGTTTGPVGGGWGSERARELTRVLYQGILMREPDAGARATTEAIQRGGYDALVRAAVGIANSDESRIRVYERQGVCNEQRLLALYKTFWNVSSTQIERRQWDADLRRMRDGQLDLVVTDLLRSDRFRSRYNLNRR
jgi:hypothetical protein